MQIRILVVDDEKETGDYLQLLLSKAGYEVVALTDPTQVLDRIRAEDFHLVILDMMMPQMSGTEVLEKIRSFDSDIAVIVATAHPAVDTAVASLKAQASDYVKKPVEPEDLDPTLACEATNLSRSSAISSVRRAAVSTGASIKTMVAVQVRWKQALRHFVRYWASPGPPVGRLRIVGG